MLKLASVFHHLPSVGPKQLCALAHLGRNREAAQCVTKFYGQFSEIIWQSKMKVPLYLQTFFFLHDVWLKLMQQIANLPNYNQQYQTT